jgi:hypothetical protein
MCNVTLSNCLSHVRNWTEFTGLVRFLQQFETGHGDYTADRHKWLGEPTVQDLAEEIERQRRSQSGHEAVGGEI